MGKRKEIMERFDGIRACIHEDMVRDDEEYDFQELCTIFGVSPQTIGNWAKQGKICYYKKSNVRYVSGKHLKRLIVNKKTELKNRGISEDDIKVSERGRPYT